MAKPKPVQRRCGTCQNWTGNPKSSAIFECAYPLPEPPILPEAFDYLTSQWRGRPPASQGVDRMDGATCPTWADKAPPPPAPLDLENIVRL